MEKYLLSLFTGREDGLFTRSDLINLVRIPTIVVAILTLPLAIGANFVDREKSYWMLIVICSAFGITSFFSGTERNRVLAIIFTCFWTAVVIIYSAMQRARV